MKSEMSVQVIYMWSFCSVKSVSFFLTILLLIFSFTINTKADENTLKLYRLCYQHSFLAGELTTQPTGASDNNYKYNYPNLDNFNLLKAPSFSETDTEIFISFNSQILAFSKPKLERIWSFEIAGTVDFIKLDPNDPKSLIIYSKEYSIEGKTYIITTLSTKTGVPFKKQKFIKNNQFKIPRITASILYNESIINENHSNLRIINNTVTLIQSQKFNKIWEFKTGGKVSDFIDMENELIIGSFDNFLYSLQKQNGSLKWKKRFPNRVSKLYRINSEEIGVRSVEKDEIFLINKKDGKNLGRIVLKSNTAPIIISFDENYGFIVLTTESVALFTDESIVSSKNCNKKAI